MKWKHFLIKILSYLKLCKFLLINFVFIFSIIHCFCNRLVLVDWTKILLLVSTAIWIQHLVLVENGSRWVFHLSNLSLKLPLWISLINVSSICIWPFNFLNFNWVFSNCFDGINFWRLYQAVLGVFLIKREITLLDCPNNEIY